MCRSLYEGHSRVVATAMLCWKKNPSSREIKVNVPDSTVFSLFFLAQKEKKWTPCSCDCPGLYSFAYSLSWQNEKEADCQTEEDWGDYSCPGVCGWKNNSPQNLEWESGVLPEVEGLHWVSGMLQNQSFERFDCVTRLSTVVKTAFPSSC